MTAPTDDPGFRDRSPVIAESFDRFLRDKAKGRDNEGGNYRRNAERELHRFHGWLTGERGSSEWDGLADTPTFDQLSERVFRAYARHLASDRGLKQNTVRTYYAYVSAWCGWCVSEGYLDAHYAQRAGATAPLPDDDGRKPGDQQAWSAADRHAITRHVDRAAAAAIDAYAAPSDEAAPVDTDGVSPRDHSSSTDTDETTQTGTDTTGSGSGSPRYTAIKACRNRALVYVLAYTAVRIGEVLRDPDDPRRRGVRWSDVDLTDNGLQVYRKKQSWDVASLPEPVVPVIRRYRQVLDPPSESWPVFPTLDRRTLSDRVQAELADRGLRPDVISERRADAESDLFLALDADVSVPSLTTDGGRRVLRQLCADAGLSPDGPHDYLAPHGARRGMGEVLVRAFGYTVAARYLDNSEAMVRERYSHIEAGELGDVALDALRERDEL